MKCWGHQFRMFGNLRRQNLAGGRESLGVNFKALQASPSYFLFILGFLIGCNISSYLMYLLLCLPDHKDHILRILIHKESFLHRVTFYKYLVRAARKTTNTIPVNIPVLCPLRGQQLLSLLPCSGNGDALYSQVLRRNTLREWNPHYTHSHLSITSGAGSSCECCQYPRCHCTHLTCVAKLWMVVGLGLALLKSWLCLMAL